MQRNILEYLEQTVHRVPDKIAFSSEEYALTFREVYAQARAIGTRIIRDGYYKQPIVVFMKKHPKTITAFLGTIYAGCYYVPLDEDMPRYRIELILQNLNPAACMKRTKLFFALTACAAILILLQMLLVPKYMEHSPEGALIGEYYENAGGNDVIFIGDCEVYENFSPIALWEEYGITSYIRGSAQQTIWQSYYLMEETFRYETPEVIVFNVLSMKYDTPESTGSQTRREAYNRMTLDTMRWSSSKWNAILASMTEEEKQWGSMFTYLFPVLRYHDRWSQLTQEDFTYWLHRDTVSHNGYLMQTGVKPYTTAYEEPPLADYSFGDNSWYYLDKMVQLCAEHGTKLVLIKAPSLSPVWWEQWDMQIEEYAGQHGLLYINMLDHQTDIGIDWNTDTYDAGLHLNVHGAEKASVWLGHILAEEYRVPDRRNEKTIAALWSDKAANYHERKRSLENETN